MIEPHRVRHQALLATAIAAAALLGGAGCSKDSSEGPVSAAQTETDADGVVAVPFRLRVVKGVRSEKAFVDPRLEPVRKQLATLAWRHWDQLSDLSPTLKKGIPTFVRLPDGAEAALTLLEVRGSIVTIEVAIAQKNTQTRVTVEKGERILHQVMRERKGIAYFFVITPWP